MKLTRIGFFLSLLVLGIVCFTWPKNSSSRPDAIVTAEQTDVLEESEPPNSEWNLVSGTETDRLPEQEEPQSDKVRTETTVHIASDFRCGEQQNILVTDCLRVGNFKEAAESVRFSGVYISPEQASLKPFTGLVLDLEGSCPSNAEINLELRTRSEREDWSAWRSIWAEDLNAPSLMQSPAISWQYRLTFYADDPADSPIVNWVSGTVHFVSDGK